MASTISVSPEELSRIKNTKLRINHGVEIHRVFTTSPKDVQLVEHILGKVEPDFKAGSQAIYAITMR